MFGYVRPPLGMLAREESDRFRQMYCGLCHTLKQRYGPMARWILNYDFTFLAILLSDGDELPERRRCAAHPLHGRQILASTDAVELAADESVILARYQLLDGVQDHGPLRRLPWRGGMAVLEPAYRRAAAYRPAFDAAVREQLSLLRQLETEPCPSLDRPADTFAALMRHAAADIRDPLRRRVLEQILYHMGRWIYLIDAADDLVRDAKEGNYNPVALRYELSGGRWTPEARREFVLTLDHSIHMITTAFELWDFGLWRPVLEATFYTGLFQTGRAVLDGTFQKRPLSGHEVREEYAGKAGESR